MSGSSRVSEGVEGVDFPADAIPLRSIGPEKTVIDVDDDSSDNEGNSPDEEDEDNDPEGGEYAEEQGGDGETEEDATVSSSRHVGDTGEGEASLQPKKRPRKKITPLDPDLIPNRMGKEPCPYWECFSSPAKYDLFRQVYDVPNDVDIRPVEGSRILYSDDHVTVPLMAITEGGLRFPMHRVLREVLHRFQLTPCQLSVNSYRIIHSVIKLAEVKMFPLEAHHIFENYMMSRNVRFSRYYLCSRRFKEKIIPGGMYDSEKWASDYVEVRGNFQFPPGEYGKFEVAVRRGEPSKHLAKSLSFSSFFLRLMLFSICCI